MKTSEAKSKVDDCLVWAKGELQMLETLTDFKAKRPYEGVNLKSVKPNARISQAYFQIYPKKVADIIFTKDWIAPIALQLNYKYKKALGRKPLGKQNGAGRTNCCFIL